MQYNLRISNFLSQTYNSYKNCKINQICVLHLLKKGLISKGSNCLFFYFYPFRAFRLQNVVINFAIIIASNANRDDKLILSRSAAFYVNMPTDGSNLFKVCQANATIFWPFLVCSNFPEFFPRGTSWRFINGTSNHVTNFVLVWNQDYSFGSQNC